MRHPLRISATRPLPGSTWPSDRRSSYAPSTHPTSSVAHPMRLTTPASTIDRCPTNASRRLTTPPRCVPTAYSSSLLTAYHSLLTTHHSHLTTHYSLLTAHHSLLTTHYSLLTAHYLQGAHPNPNPNPNPNPDPNPNPNPNPNPASQVRVPVKSGDVVVLATDGLFDNMPEQVALLTMALLTMALLTMASSTTCPSRWPYLLWPYLLWPYLLWPYLLWPLRQHARAGGLPLQ
jgi:hypothetical protein